MPKVQTLEDFNCPITQQLMFDPVIASDGHTYEREAIEKWLEKNNTSPMINTVLQHKYLAPNFFAKKTIEQFLKDNNVCSEEKFWEVIKEGNVEELKKINFLERHLESKDDNSGSSPFTVAVERRHLAVAKILLENGAKIDHKNASGWTVLHWAAGGYFDIVKFLLDHGANIEATDAYGETALHSAAECGDEDIVKLLLERGANYHATNKDNRTPAQLAQGSFPKLAKLIPKYRQHLKIAKLNDVINKQKEEIQKQQVEIEALKHQLETTDQSPKRFKKEK
jgi:ankyrin repeat protein